MPKVTYIEANGREHGVDVQVDQTLMDGAMIHDVPGIVALCGGLCSCSTCHCYISSPWAEKLAPPTDGELATLDMAWNRRPDSRLSCQIVMTEALDNIVVRLPEHQSIGETDS
jgi:2Fe-2S ferredoxin